MAYIEKERVAEIRAELKKLFPTFKFSVTRQDHSSVVIKILKGDIDFFDDAMRPDGTNNHGETYKLSDYRKEQGHTSVNHFWIEDHWCGEAQEMLLKIKEIACKGNVDRNAGDMGADYPAWNFFVEISIGAYNRPYELIEKVAKAA